jgi:hypothetical protein
MPEQNPAPQYRPPAALNLLTLEPGTHVRLIGDVIAEVVDNPQDGVWLLLRYVSVPDSPDQVGSEEMVFAEDVIGLA